MCTRCASLCDGALASLHAQMWFALSCLDRMISTRPAPLDFDVQRSGLREIGEVEIKPRVTWRFSIGRRSGYASGMPPRRLVAVLVAAPAGKRVEQGAGVAVYAIGARYPVLVGFHKQSYWLNLFLHDCLSRLPPLRKPSSLSTPLLLTCSCTAFRTHLHQQQNRLLEAACVPTWSGPRRRAFRAARLRR